MIHYTQDKSSFGPSTTIINAKGAHINSLKQTVKAVVLNTEEFTSENLKKVLRSKAAGIIAAFGGDDFVPTKQWDEAYQYLRKFEQF